jgi:putative aminopeptidase FrvX
MTLMVRKPLCPYFEGSEQGMNARTICILAERLMRHPAVPYYEHAVRDEVERICAENGLAFKRDRFGNVLVRLRNAPDRRPLALAAHLDHPGFEIVRSAGEGRCLARFQGGVPDHYFRAGIKLRLMPGAVAATLGQRTDMNDRALAVQSLQRAAAAPRFAVWELEDFAVRNGRIYGRACDDLVGVAAVLATMIELKRRRAPVNVIGVISRAEEVGLDGALAIAATGGLPRRSLIISLETSRELPGVQMGRGVILRVGDRTSIFNSQATRFLAEVAATLKSQRKSFEFQRALMSGGTCEGTAYQEFGYQTAAVCVTLGNYHNCAPRNRIRAEYVNISDACGMVDLLVSVAFRMGYYTRLVQRLPKRLRAMGVAAERKLRRTAATG